MLKKSNTLLLLSAIAFGIIVFDCSCKNKVNNLNSTPSSSPVAAITFLPLNTDKIAATTFKDPNEYATDFIIKRYKVTAYCPCVECCGVNADGVTASGHYIKPGDHFVAADKSLSFGTMVLVPGYNKNDFVKVLDRGGKIKGNRLDVFFPTHAEALNWGVQELDVVIIGGGD